MFIKRKSSNLFKKSAALILKNNKTAVKVKIQEETKPVVGSSKKTRKTNPTEEQNENN